MGLLTGVVAIPKQVVVVVSRTVADAAERTLLVLEAAPALDDAADPKIRAVRQAQRSAAVRGDAELARQLADVEQFLVQRLVQPAGLLSRARGNGIGLQLESIRKDLLRNTPRPDDNDR